MTNTTPAAPLFDFGFTQVVRTRYAWQVTFTDGTDAMVPAFRAPKYKAGA